MAFNKTQVEENLRKPIPKGGALVEILHHIAAKAPSPKQTNFF